MPLTDKPSPGSNDHVKALSNIGGNNAGNSYTTNNHTVGNYSSKGSSEANDSRYGGMKLIPREILYGNPEKEHVPESPDGRLVAYMAPVNNVMNIWVGPLDNFSQIKPITNDAGRGFHTYGWM